MALQRAEWITITTIILTGFVTAAISLGGIYYSNIKSKETLKLEIDSQKDLLEENFKKQREEANHQIKIKEKTVAFYKAMNVMDAHLSQQCWGGFHRGAKSRPRAPAVGKQPRQGNEDQRAQQVDRHGDVQAERVDAERRGDLWNHGADDGGVHLLHEHG